MAAKAIDHYMHNLERGYGCGYLKIGKDPAWESVPEKRPPWQSRPIPYRSFPSYKMTARKQRQVLLDRQVSVEYARLMRLKLDAETMT